jgi:hypothetical protein
LCNFFGLFQDIDMYLSSEYFVEQVLLQFHFLLLEATSENVLAIRMKDRFALRMYRFYRPFRGNDSKPCVRNAGLM